MPLYAAYYGPGNGLIHMDVVQCTGDEEHLLNCTFIENKFFGHNRDASVNCTVAECTEGKVRLVGGLNKTEGKVEICLYGFWGIVCDNLWTVSEAKLVCKQLGFPYTGIFIGVRNYPFIYFPYS